MGGSGLDLGDVVQIRNGQTKSRPNDVSDTLKYQNG